MKKCTDRYLNGPLAITYFRRLGVVMISELVEGPFHLPNVEVFLNVVGLNACRFGAVSILRGRYQRYNGGCGGSGKKLHIKM